MPVIVEEPESFTDDDFNALLNVPELTLENPDHDGTAVVDPAFGEEGRPYLALCPIHPDSADCTCPGFVDDWELPEAQTDPLAGLEEPDYSKHENWIPRFFRPEKPCDYCRSRRLDCYLQRGEPHCTPCASLFRECSLVNSNTLEATNHVEDPVGMLIDTLHVVDEDAAIEKGTFTGVKPLRSNLGYSGTSTPVRGDDAPGSNKRNGIRFPRHAVKTLRDWLDSHIDHPYPTEEEKAELEKQTELKPNQIANWLANARRRKKVTQRARPRSCMSPSLRPTTPAMAIPGADEKPWEELNPFERWKNSPPENDPASILDIANAVANSDLPADGVSSSPSSMGRRGKGSSNGSAFSNVRAPSTTSQETGRTSSLSASSIAFSHNSSVSTHGSYGSFSSSLVGKKDRRRTRRRPAPPPTAQKSADDKKRIFQCTFCTDTFKAKYDWTRHEKSLHLSLEKWICAPQGPIVTTSDGTQTRCAYCDLHNPSTDHLETHNHKQCEDKGLDSRTFFRKDHLRQHLRLMHGCEMTKSMDAWKATASQIRSRCGFCSQRFDVWQDRIDHLTAHFKAGARMLEWKGCRGLDPSIAAQVTNAMPPYLIGIEAVSPNPFSATNRAWNEPRLNSGMSSEGDCDGFGQLAPQNATASIFAASGSKATCWEILTVHLGQYAKKMAAEGQVMTDEMLQTQARRILYDSDDTWNQTAADNPEWLDLFKKAHGLDFIPNALGGQGLYVPEDLETYGDLGLRIPFVVQLQALNKHHNERLMEGATECTGSRQDIIEQRRTELQNIYADLAKDGVLYSDEQKCGHAACATNIIDFGTIDGASATGYSPKRWCSHEVSPERANQMAEIAARAKTNAEVIGAVVMARRQEHAKRDGEQARQQAAYLSANARARSLVALARAEAPLLTGDSGRLSFEPSLSSGPKITPRYRFQLPDDRVRQFATATGAWQDAGIMPASFDTAAATTTAGAMMEFLGGNLTAPLPSSSDAVGPAATTTATAATAADALPQAAFSAEELEWQLPEAGPGADQALMEELDELIRATTSAAEDSIPAPAGGMEAGVGGMGAGVGSGEWAQQSPREQVDTAMEDFSFDDIIFDGVFDMPLDE